MRASPRACLMAGVLAATACAGRPAIAPTPVLPFAADTIRAERISDGVTRRFFYSAAGPWAIHVLEVDVDGCVLPVAVKGARVAVGRIKTTDMLKELSSRQTVLAGVNADFFSLTDGTPTGLLVVNGQMLTPPTPRPVLAVDSLGVVHVGTFSRSAAGLRPYFPRDAVGGRPLLVRDSVLLASVDSAGGAAFAAARHPRTAAGVSRDGHRLILAVVDGRQKPYSDGMTLRELGTLMLALGARDALNLDGGGSTTFVYADPQNAGALVIANKPSDKEGERAVGDALAIVRTCGSR